MLFAIVGGLPYLVGGSMIYPVCISGGAVTVDEAHGEEIPAGCAARYSLREITAKLGSECDSRKKAKTGKTRR